MEDGPAVSVSTAQMTGCAAALSWMRHDRDGTVLDLGRRRRRPSAALRRAARERDTCRCRFPGCQSRRIDLHHIQYWSPGIPPSPALPQPDGTIDDCHDAEITPETIIPPWYGERLDLDYAIYTCFANAEYHARQRDQAGQPDQQPATAAAPEDEPWRPILTEMDIIAGIQELCQQHAPTGHH